MPHNLDKAQSAPTEPDTSQAKDPPPVERDMEDVGGQRKMRRLRGGHTRQGYITRGNYG